MPGRPQAEDAEVIKRIQRSEHRLVTAGDLDPLLAAIGDARYVLLGEASHGTSEFYTWRAQLSQRLISEKGFSFIAVEGDWPDCYCVNRYIKGYNDAGESAHKMLQTFDRWPTWMWANWEIVVLTEWLRRTNQQRPRHKQVGFYGLDVYLIDQPVAMTVRGHRAIGVVYKPNQERGNYVPTILLQRYDAFLYIDQTEALHPLPIHPAPAKPPETYPWGV